MFQQTDNPYRFQYLITGITGTGIEQVYLPPQPPDSEILFLKEGKFSRQEMPRQLKTWAKEWRTEREKNKNYQHSHAEEILAWEDREWERSENGVWFWSNGVPTYITGFYYWYLTDWLTYFGYPIYRETDKELTYFIQFCEEDPDCYGGAVNTIRRYGKSSIFGAWIVYRTSRNRHHTAGMQGETQNKISKFYNKMVLKPFVKLPYYYQPTYDTSSTQRNEIKFDVAPRRGKRREYSEDGDVLESILDYRATHATEYDGEALDTFYVEEAGKIMEESIYSLEGDGIIDIIKPALRKGRKIRGKCMLATTCEFMDVTDRGGKAYKQLFYDSDYNDKKDDGRTKSGLYAAFLPGDVAYEDYLDEWGHPIRDKARAAILQERASFKDSPSKLAGSIRRYPLSITEIFYINPARCVFSRPDVLQNAITAIDQTVGSLYQTFDLSWQNGLRPWDNGGENAKVIFRQSDYGWLKLNRWPDIKDCNKVGIRYEAGRKLFYPLNDEQFAVGFDPVQMRVANTTKTSDRISKPVSMIKRKYDANIDGVMDDELKKKRAEEKYPYITGRYWALMDTRPNDPNILFERQALICWCLGCSVHVEKQKDAFISWMFEKGLGDFVMAKFTTEYNAPTAPTEGTASTPTLIENYSTLLDTWITNFGHTIWYRPQAEDHLHFKPHQTQEHDHTVACGFAELAEKIRPKIVQAQFVDISHYMPVYNSFGDRVA